jgi:murein peptide amidase A
VLNTNDSVVGRQELQRLGKNVKGYCGETIDIDALLADALGESRKHGWKLEALDAGPNLSLLALQRTGQGVGPRVYLSTGIHGDEPAGPLAMLQLLKENLWPANVDLWLCPCLNPGGYRANKRENAEGFDLNRQYLHSRTRETRAHMEWLARQPGFDVCLCLHEDWESHGFYLYELNPDHLPSCAEGMIQAVMQVCPVDFSEVIEGRPASGGVIRPSVDPRSRPDWPEAFYLLTYKTRLSYTLEAPSDWPLKTRVAALVTAARAAVAMVARPAARS